VSTQSAALQPGAAGTSRIAFTRPGRLRGEQIFTMRPDGSDLRQLTGGAGQGSNWGPAWSPDGGRICFSSDRNGHAHLYLIAPDGSARQQLTNDPGASDFEPGWSPDGARIAFARGDDSADDLWLVEVATGEAHPLTSEGRLDGSPAWSPDGRWIVFHRALGSPSGLYTIPAAGGEARFLASGTHPSWAIGGGDIAFAHGGSLWLLGMTADGTTDGRARLLVCSAQMVIGGSSWSPDGGALVFETQVTDASGMRDRLMLVSVEGGEPRDLGPGYQPNWSPRPR